MLKSLIMKAGMILAVFLILVGCAEAQTPVYIIAGGSNACGKGNTAQLLPSRRKVPKNVTYYDNGERLTRLGVTHGIEAGLFKKISRRHKQSMVIKVCRGNTSIKKYLNRNGKEYIRLIKSVVEANPKNPVFYFIWLKVGKDSKSFQSARYYGAYLARLRGNLQKDMRLKRFVVVGMAPDNPDRFPYFNRLRRGQIDFARTYRNAVFVDAKRLKQGKDGIHYRSRELRKIGYRVSRAI